MSNDPAQNFEDGPHEARAFAEYVEALIAELALLAHKHGLETLASLLEIARLEAEATKSHGRPKN